MNRTPRTTVGSRFGLAALMLLLLPLDAPAQAVIESDGAAELGVALRRLATTKRVLMIAAHPDDENTALIAELALGDGADVAYLSLTRGEGGQNLIGPELQEGLGLIRTEELLAARRLDGARQYFTRAYDYGFSKSAAEAFTQWPRDSLLADVVEVVRRYRPDIIVSVFSGTAEDGHGQHQAAGIMAREAFTAAADSTQYAAQLAAGLRPHAAAYLFQALWRPPADPPIRIETGDYDPLFGRSRFQIAMQSRSRHRSQDMGAAQSMGPQSTALRVMAGDYPAGTQSLFAGLDTTLAQHARRAGAPAPALSDLLRYESDVALIRDSLSLLGRPAPRSPLVDAVRALDAALARLGSERFAVLRDLIAWERSQAADALLLHAGVLVDATADTPTPVPGTSFELAVTLWNGGATDVTVRDIRPRLPPAWSFRASSPEIGALAPGSVARRTFSVTVPENAAPTEPYFLRAARTGTGAMYSWHGEPDSVRALPFQPDDIAVGITLDPGVEIRLHRPASYMLVDKALGELRSPLRVVPAATVSVEPRIAVIPAGDVSARPVAVTVQAARDGMRGVLSLSVPPGWQVEPASVGVGLDSGESRTSAFAVTPPSDATGQFELRAAFESDGRTYGRGSTTIDYPHIRPRPLYSDAVVRATVFPVRIARDLRVGYIDGAGDDGALALRQMGAAVEPLDAAALARGDLTAYDAIVAGIRAYEVRPDLIANNDRLLDYVRTGGTFIVQYNKYELVDGGFMPYPATMSRPHGRITDATAEVHLLSSDHRALSWPNRIAESDFEDWVQERGLYYLESWDDRYEALLSMADPGEQPLRGALVVGRVGDGWYAYTGLSLFRQFPEGVPGAYRLLANLVSLGATR